MQRMRRLVFASLAILVGCSLFDSEESPEQLRVVWKTPTAVWGGGTPGLFADKIIASFEDQRLRAFRLDDGRLAWTGASAGRNLHAREVYVSSDSIAIVTAATEIHGYSAVDGSIRWRIALPPDSTVDVTQGGGVAQNELSLDATRTKIAVAAWGSTAAALRTRNGEKVWSWSAGLPNLRRHGANGALWCGNKVFVALWQYLDENGTRSQHSIAALDATTGQELWRTLLPFESIVVSANGKMACDNEMLFATTMGGPVWALFKETGAVGWRADRSRGYLNNTGPLLVNGVVFADDGIDERIVARRASDGSVLWRTAIGQVPNYSMQGGNALLWIAPGHNLHILDARSGSRLIVEAPDGWSSTWPPLLLDERNAVVATGNGVMRVRIR
jgi:outer membrane protein assembly factor BamB